MGNTPNSQVSMATLRAATTQGNITLIKSVEILAKHILTVTNRREGSEGAKHIANSFST